MRGAIPVVVRPALPKGLSGKVTAVSASGADQIASRDVKARHGLFTHHLLEAHYGRGDEKGNRFGLHDMHSNVWEWVEDCWNDSYAGALADGNAWTGGDCAKRDLRGGSWGNEPRNLRSADCFRIWSGNRFNDGFRVARTLEP